MSHKKYSSFPVYWLFDRDYYRGLIIPMGSIILSYLHRSLTMVTDQDYDSNVVEMVSNCSTNRHCIPTSGHKQKGNSPPESNIIDNICQLRN